MERTFADIVEDVRALSPAEQVELQTILGQALVAAQREDFARHYQESLEELERGDYTFGTDVAELMAELKKG